VARESALSDDDRQKLEAALAAAITLIYQHHQTEAFAQLNALERSLHLTPAAMQKINAKAREVADSVQAGINSRIAAAYDQATQDGSNPTTAAASARQSIHGYNDTTLTPYLVSWAAQRGVIDAYSAVPNPDLQGQSMRDAVQWEWQQLADYPDECAEAAAASPASYDELTGITGGDPPIHRNCGCSLTPVGA